MKRPKADHEAYELPKGEFNEKKWARNQRKYIDQVEKQLQEQAIIALSQSEQAEDQKARIKLLSEGYEDLEAEKKELKESIEALLLLIDSRLSLIDGKTIGKGRSIIWNRVVEAAQKLIK